MQPDAITRALLVEAAFKHAAIEAILDKMVQATDPANSATDNLDIANAAYALINRLTD